MYAVDLTTGRHYDVEVTRETKCYYIGNLLNYRGQFRWSFRVHKKTMNIDHMYLSFFKEEL